ncbi:hypothetical protein NHL50_15115 [Acidimicrobiia bacterium EGI L10123]|uniref:LVIVD repeat-containing protein n=1 Tax=Salinilacustrithrix flava TaxID=2957203 RepID=UPI003D7C1AB8|nr:hypothetical protein [Acidimicrobiia bacterium EGI L10123]
MRRQDRPLVAVLGLVSICSTFLAVSAATAAPLAEPALLPTPQVECGPDDAAETDIQGRVTPEDHASGRAERGFWCNAERIGTFGGDAVDGTVGGFKVERYVDASGRECAYYDSTLLLGTDLFDGGIGTNVLDMSDPANPVKTASLVTPAMLSPHESLLVNQERGLLVATLGNPAFNVGILDVYDLTEDCRSPKLLSSSPAGILGHESGFAPDGMTFYSASPATQTLVPVDLSDPTLPVPLTSYRINSHGLSLSADGTRAYVASLDGLVILDVSEVQAREPDPVIREVSRLSWESMSIPQNAIPITIDGHPYVVEIDEFGAQDAVGAARIIDIADETRPQVISNLRLEVHQPEHFEQQSADPGSSSPIQGYAAHYCNVPTRVDPTIVACSMILSGLRVFSIVDPANPVEIAYYNAPSDPNAPTAGSYAMASPTFVPERDEIWYSDGHSGFHAVRLADGVWPAAGSAPVQPAPPTTEPTTTAAPSTATAPAQAAAPTLPATGGGAPLGLALAAALSGAAALWLATRGRRAARP